jgi:NAD-dependent deacetylase sirtuin 1
LGEGLLDKILEQDNPYDTLLDVHREIEEMAEMFMNHRKKLPDINTADDAIERIKNAKRVLVVSGAGVSVSSGIPDFRSPGGLYDQIQQKYTLPDPHCLFDINYLKKDPIPFFDFSKQLYPGEAKPAPGHKFVRLLETKLQLLRNYTQNIDTLEKIAGINKVLLCHGSFATASCISCKFKVEGEALREEIMASKIPYCKVCKDEKSFMKPDIVFFGEALPQEFFDTIQEDCKACDLLIVMGSSLKVHPVALIPRVIAELNPEIPQFLINNQVVYEPHEWDYCFLGSIDDSVKLICDKLGWNVDDTAQQPAKSEASAVVLTPKKKSSVNNTDNNDPPTDTTDNQKDPQ